MTKQDSVFTCALCGKHDDIPSTVTLQALYGSQLYDGESYTLNLCCGCIDGWIELVRLHILPEGMHVEQQI